MSCEQCTTRESDLLETRKERDYLRHIVGSIRKMLEYAHEERPRGRQPREYTTEVGKLIAATASAKRKKLSTVSAEIGRAADYVARICRGDLKLDKPHAILIGGALGIDLIGYVGDERRPEEPAEQAGPAVPSEPSAPGRFELVAPGAEAAP